jgi:hypothetical protein
MNWISVEDRLPEEGTNCLISCAFAGEHTAIWRGHSKGFVCLKGYKPPSVTHWMLFPKPSY